MMGDILPGVRECLFLQLLPQRFRCHFRGTLPDTFYFRRWKSPVPSRCADNLNLSALSPSPECDRMHTQLLGSVFQRKVDFGHE